MPRSESGAVMARLLLVLLLAGLLVLAGVAAFRTGAAPTIAIEPARPGIGRSTPVRIAVEGSARGLDGLRVELVQGDRTHALLERDFTPTAPWEIWKEGTRRAEVRIDVGRDTVKGLRQGEATIRVTAQRPSALLRSPDPAVRELKLPVRLTPPTLHELSSAVYVAQGGCEAVTYRVGETAVRDGVRAGEWWFPGTPLPGGAPRDRFALFAVPHDVSDPASVRLVATDDVGNEASVAFIDEFFPRRWRADTIQVDDAFLQKVVDEIMSHTPELEDRGSPLDNWLAINRGVRAANARTLVELARSSKPSFLWAQPFFRMRSAPTARFGDHRTYLYGGREVDQQDHLGEDMADTEGIAVPAANDGVVVLARYFGIYGNTVIVDHGYGLMSLYGHLSAIDVKEGDTVRREQRVGLTGETGLAGGDHLHFAMLLHGLPVQPTEWWDAHWIQDRLARKLPTLRQALLAQAAPSSAATAP